MDLIKYIPKPADWLHWTIVVIVFSLTGTLSMLLSGLLLRGILQLNGDLWSGPWSYRFAYLTLILPLYSVTLVAVGTLLGKHAYFKQRVLRMWGFLMPRQIRRRIMAVTGQRRSNGFLERGGRRTG